MSLLAAGEQGLGLNADNDRTINERWRLLPQVDLNDSASAAEDKAARALDNDDDDDSEGEEYEATTTAAAGDNAESDPLVPRSHASLSRKEPMHELDAATLPTMMAMEDVHSPLQQPHCLRTLRHRVHTCYEAMLQRCEKAAGASHSSATIARLPMTSSDAAARSSGPKVVIALSCICCSLLIFMVMLIARGTLDGANGWTLPDWIHPGDTDPIHQPNLWNPEKWMHPTLPPPHTEPWTDGLHFAAIGSWGVSLDAQHSSATYTNGKTSYDRAFNAQIQVAKHMSLWAEKHPTSFILNTGNSFYKYGTPWNQGNTWTTSYEKVYAHEAIQTTPWLSVMGYVDYGGGNGLCGSMGSRLCTNAAAMETALTKRFKAQSGYKGAGGRWKMPDHFYEFSFGKQDKDDSGGSDDGSSLHKPPPRASLVRVFVLDSIGASNVSAHKVCCQCLATGTSPRQCHAPRASSSECAGGKVDVYHRCRALMTEWWKGAIDTFEQHLQQAKAVPWKIVNMHTLPQDMDTENQARVLTLLEEHGVQMVFGNDNARTGVGHEYIAFTEADSGGGKWWDLGQSAPKARGIHIFANAGGGGVAMKNLPSGTNGWHASEFGFMFGSITTSFARIRAVNDLGDTIYDVTVPRDGAPALKPVYLMDFVPLQERTQDLMLHMSLADKIGQMVWALDPAKNQKHRAVDDAVLAKFRLGGVMVGMQQAVEPGKEAERNRFLQEVMRGTPLHIPGFVAAHAMHGYGYVVGSTIFPHAIGMGASRDVELAGRIAHATSETLSILGVNLNLAPGLSVARDPRWGRFYESYGETAELVSIFADVIPWIQTEFSLFGRNRPPVRVAATASHFIADGETLGGNTGGITRIEQTELRSHFAKPFEEAVRRHKVDAVMLSQNRIGEAYVYQDRSVVKELLRDELGFAGVVMTDKDGLGRTTPSTRGKTLTQAVNNGVDIFIEQNDFIETVKALHDEVKAGHLDVAAVDAAVVRILSLKFKLGLWHNTMSGRVDVSHVLSRIGSESRKHLARRAVRQSLVLMQNRGGILPLSVATSKRLLVSGRAADNVGWQCGGYMLSENGVDGGEVVGGQSIYDGFKVVADSGFRMELIEYPKESDFERGWDAAIVVVGEAPYSGANGDQPTLTLDAAQVDQAEHICDKLNGQCVVIIMAGRPLLVPTIFEKAAAVVMAWFPGTEGDGVAELLFGKFEFTGKLPMTWPKTVSDIPLTADSPNYNRRDPAFRFGHGL